MPVRRSLRRFREARNRRRHGAPGEIVSLADFRTLEEHTWHLACPADTAPRVPPRNLGTRDGGLAAMALPIPELGVLELPQGRAVGQAQFAFSRENRLVRETTWYDDLLEPARLPDAYPMLTSVAGTCLSLLSEFTRRNYGHQLMDSFTRAELAWRGGFGPERIDRYYLHRPVSRSGWQMLDALGIGRDKCIWADEVPGIVAERLLVTSFPGTRRNYARIVPATLRAPFAHLPRGHAGRRIFIPRRGVRRLANEAQIEGIAVAAGLEIYDFRGVEDEFAHLQDAELVVGPHGSDLTNIAVCRPGTKVLELIPSDHVHPYFYTIAEGAGLDYAHIVGRSAEERAPGTLGASTHDFHVDPEEFRAALHLLIGELEARQRPRDGLT